MMNTKELKELAAKAQRFSTLRFDVRDNGFTDDDDNPLYDMSVNGKIWSNSITADEVEGDIICLFYGDQKKTISEAESGRKDEPELVKFSDIRRRNMLSEIVAEKLGSMSRYNYFEKDLYEVCVEAVISAAEEEELPDDVKRNPFDPESYSNIINAVVNRYYRDTVSDKKAV